MKAEVRVVPPPPQPEPPKEVVLTMSELEATRLRQVAFYTRSIPEAIALEPSKAGMISPENAKSTLESVFHALGHAGVSLTDK